MSTSALQILAVAGPVSCRDGTELLVPTAEFTLGPALFSLAATRVDLVRRQTQLHEGLIGAVGKYARESMDGEQARPRLGQPVDLARVRSRALDRCFLGFVKRAVSLFHDEDAEWVLRQAARIARDGERTLIERGLVVKTVSPRQGSPVTAVLGLMPYVLPARSHAGGRQTAYRLPRGMRHPR